MQPVLVNISYLPWVPGRRKRNETIFFHLLRDSGLFSAGVYVNPPLVQKRNRGMSTVTHEALVSKPAGDTWLHVIQPILHMSEGHVDIASFAQLTRGEICGRYLHGVPYVLWMNSAEYFEYHLALALGREATVRVFDLSDDFSTFEHANCVLFKRCLARMLRLANRALYVNEHVARKFPHDCGLVFRNGADLEYFQAQGERFVHAQLFPKPPGAQYAGYVGSLSRERLDMGILEHALAHCTDLQFIFAGYSNSQNLLDHLLSFPNTHYISDVPYSALPDLIRQFDVGVIPHRVNELTNGNDLLKVHDYLACQIPVVSTACSNIHAFSPPVRIAQGAEEFCRMLRTAMGTWRDADKAIGLSLVRQWSWDTRMHLLFTWLGKACTQDRSPIAVRDYAGGVPGGTQERVVPGRRAYPGSEPE